MQGLVLGAVLVVLVVTVLGIWPLGGRGIALTLSMAVTAGFLVVAGIVTRSELRRRAEPQRVVVLSGQQQ